MHDATRRLLTLAVSAALAFAAFLALRPHLGGGDGYGFLDLLRGNTAPASTNGGDGGPQAYTTPDTPPLGPADVPGLASLSHEVATLMDRVRPTVVSINTTQRYEVASGFRISALGVFRESRFAERPGLGSGVIVTNEGHVVTNHHVIEDVDEIEVITHSGRAYPADLVGSEPGADIAVLKIRAGDRESFPALPFGDSSKVRVGETVFAVGNPYGLGETVTDGLISALPRQVSETGYKTFQTNTAINPGNSGGPLVNIRGEIIGINNSVFRKTNAAANPQGLSFAIPSNDARATFQTIMASERSIIGFLGVNTNNLSDLSKFQLGIRDGRGVMAVEIAPNSPAQAAGLQPGDIILAFDGKPVPDTTTLYKLIGAHKIGTDAAIDIVRDTRAATLTAGIIDKAVYLTAAADRIRAEQEGAAAKISQALGIKVQNLTDYQRHRIGIDHSTPAILVTGAEGDSPLRGQLKNLDLIVGLNERPIYNTLQFYEEIDNLPYDEKSTIHFVRAGLPYRVSFTPRRSEPADPGKGELPLPPGR